MVWLCFKTKVLKFNGNKKSFAIHGFWNIIYLMPWLLGIFPIHVGIKPGFPDFPTSSSQPLQPKPTQPLPVVSGSTPLVERGRSEEKGGRRE